MNRKHNYIWGVVSLITIFVLLIPPVYSLRFPFFADTRSYREIGLEYLIKEFPNENISIALEETYIHPETKIKYTILKGKHNDEPVKITVSHLDNTFTLGADKIKSDLNDFLESLPEPYKKMDSELRLKIRDEYGFYPSLSDQDIPDKSLSVIFLVNNTYDLVKTAKFVNSISGYPDVWNGRTKYVAGDMKLKDILKAGNLTSVRGISLNAKLHAGLSVSVPAINADDLHNLDLDGTGINVSVIDTGIDDSHPWLNGSNIIAQNDLRILYDDPDDNDPNGHGTHIACIIASNNETYKGVAPKAGILNAKISDTSEGQFLSYITLLRAVDWSIDNGADILSLSWSGTGSTDGSSMLTKLVDKTVYEDGKLFIVITGNYHSNYNPQTKILLPADAYNAISVGGAENFSGDKKVWNGSGHGKTDDDRCKVDVVAPGNQVTSCNNLWENEGYYTRTSFGTSQAAPHVSGLAALLYQFAKNKGENINPLMVKAAILNSAIKIRDINGSNWSHTAYCPLDTDQGAGFIDALEAYKTLNESGRLYYDTINGSENKYYYVNLTDAPTYLTLTLTWNRHVTSVLSTPPALENINLRLRNNTGYIVDESISFEDNVEHIRYYVSSNNEYKIEVDPVGSVTETYALASSHKMKIEVNIPLVNNWNLISLPVDVNE